MKNIKKGTYSKLIPPKLHKNDEVVIISLSNSMPIRNNVIEKAEKVFKDLGLKVNTDNCVFNEDGKTFSVKDRIECLHEAFKNSKVRAIISTTGGHYASQLLNNIKYKTIIKNPKIFCGFSDNTVLCNAIYKKTKMITYVGPNFSHFLQDNQDYTIEYFKKILFNEDEVEIYSLDEDNMKGKVNTSNMIVINEGSAKGKILGGNFLSFQLLQGTKYMPDLEDSIIFIEDISMVERFGNNDIYYDRGSFDRSLHSLCLQKDFKKVRGLVFGKFSFIERELLLNKKYNPNPLTYEEYFKELLITKPYLSDIPIIANLDFNHEKPIFTIPIGGKCILKAKNNRVSLKIIEH